MRLENDGAFSRKPIERFANGPATDAKSLDDVRLHQALASDISAFVETAHDTFEDHPR